MTAGKLYKRYETELGKALFPGTDWFSKELQSFFSEMLTTHTEKGLPISVTAICASLSEFTPLIISDSSPAWIEHQTNRWKNELRPLIFNAIESFALHGGFERRIYSQHLLIEDLENSGVEIQGKDILLERMLYQGDWHQAVIYLAERGRPLEVRFIQGPDYSEDKAMNALHGAGFNHEQIRRVLCNFSQLNLPSPESNQHKKMKISLTLVQVIAIALCVLFFIGAVLTYKPNDSAMAAVLGMWGVISGLVVFWEKEMKNTKSDPDFDVTGPGDDPH